jgi:group I intron endonuclease
MEKKFNFVYITTNSINGKQYVGDHSTDDLNDTYLGSGNIIRALNKYDRQNFKKEILEFFETKKEAFDAQEKYIVKYNTLVPIGYNISPTGGLCVKNCFKHSEESKNKIRKAHTGLTASKETKDKMGNSRKGNKNGMHGISVYDHWFNTLGKEKADKKMKEYTLKLSKSLSGKHRTKEQIKNYEKGALKRIKKLCPHCHREIDPGNFKKYHGENCKQNNA